MNRRGVPRDAPVQHNLYVLGIGQTVRLSRRGTVNWLYSGCLYRLKSRLRVGWLVAPVDLDMACILATKMPQGTQTWLFARALGRLPQHRL